MNIPFRGSDEAVPSQMVMVMMVIWVVEGDVHGGYGDSNGNGIEQ